MRPHPWILLGALLVPAACSLVETPSRTNLLLISVDSLRYDAISRSIGAANTPNIHALAQEGQSFAQCFSHTPDGLPALTALLSARMPQENGVFTSTSSIHGDTQLLAEHLKQSGYATIGVLSDAASMPPAGTPDAMNISRGFDAFTAGQSIPTDAETVNSQALTALASVPADKSWFAFVEYSEPAAPYEAWGTSTSTAAIALDGQPIENLTISDGGVWDQELELAPGKHELTIASPTAFEMRRFEAQARKGQLRSSVTTGRMNEATKSLIVSLENTGSEPAACTLSAWIHDVPGTAQARERYRLEVEAVDRAVGALVEMLKQRGQFEKTLIVVTANHGEALGEHKRIGSGQGLYDEILRIPFIVKPPRGCEGAAGLSKLTLAPLRQSDIVPTALELLGAPAMSGATGQSARAGGERTILSLAFPPFVQHALVSCRDARFKLIFDSATSQFEMYDVQADAVEVDNVYELKGTYRSNWQGELRALAARAPRPAPRVGMALPDPGSSADEPAND